MEKGSRNAIVSFSPLEGVDSYSILISQEGGGERTLSVLPSSFSLGRFYREIKGLKPDTTYSLTLEVESNGEKGEVEETFVFKTEDGSSDKPEYAPYAYCSIRNEDSAVIEFTLEEGMSYRMVLQSKVKGVLYRKKFVFQYNVYDDSYTMNVLKKDKA